MNSLSAIRPGLLPDRAVRSARDFCPIERFGSDDACIEICSVYRGPAGPPWYLRHCEKPGWTLDVAKRTDLLVYAWPVADAAGQVVGRRFWMVYFPILARAAIAEWRAWGARYGVRPAWNEGYATLNVFPPRAVIAAAMQRQTRGEVRPPAVTAPL